VRSREVNRKVVVGVGRSFPRARRKGADERDEATADSYGFIVASKALSSASQAGRAYQRSSGH
jgi:hypothetical protein